jgi:formylglycine-generating enzyme required for sulfatase activity
MRQKDEERTGLRFKPVRASVDPGAPVKFWMSQTEVTNEQFLKFVEDLRKDQIPRELRHWSDLTLVKKRVEAMSGRFDEFRRNPALPVVAVDWEAALGFAAWTGGRLPSKDEWIGAAGKYLLPAAEFPVFLENGVPRSGEYWMRDPGFAVFQRSGSREDRRAPVTELLRREKNAPFGIVGFAGNVAEWVTAEPGGRKVLGTMGGSFKYPYSNEVDNPRLDREPRLSAADAGIRIVWPAQVKGP